MLCFGTEDRQTEKNVAASTAVLPFVSFPGGEIKDLYVHEPEESQAPPPAKTQQLPTPKPLPKHMASDAQRNRSNNNANNNNNNNSSNNNNNNNSNNNNNNNNNNQKTSAQQSKVPRPPLPAAGTGEHLLKLKERTAGSSAMESPEGEFDFESALTSFKKDQVLAEVASENAILAGCYIKDNFFDTLSSSVDPENARKDRLTPNEERVLNQDTFGAIALQQNTHHRRHGNNNTNQHHHGGHGGRGGNGGYGGRGGHNNHNNRGGYHQRGRSYRGGGGGDGSGRGNNNSGSGHSHNHNHGGSGNGGGGGGSYNRRGRGGRHQSREQT